MDNLKYEKFIKEEKIDTNIKYYKNKVEVKFNSKAEKILFLPINYNDGYTATNNGEHVEVLKVYDNFIGIKLNKGDNNISISFIPKCFIPCLIISAITLVIMIILIKTNLYQKILDIKFLNQIAYYVYLTIYLGIILVIYVCLTIVFILSYFMPVHLF